LGPKRLELLHELVPKATVIAFLVNPANPVAASQIQEIREPARSLGLQVHVLEASSEAKIEIACEALMQQRIGALLLANDTFWSGRRQLFIALAARHAIPVMYPARDAVAAGGLMSYDASAEDSFRQVGTYVGRILKGEKPADLPVLQPTKFELALNVKTAKALGLDVPPMLIARADEVIEGGAGRTKTVSRAQRSASRRRVVRCRPGTVTARGGPGSAVHRSTSFRAVPHPGHEALGAASSYRSSAARRRLRF